MNKVQNTQITTAETVELRQTDDGLALVGRGMELLPDYTHLLPRLRPSRLHKELLVRAARVRGVGMPTAIDATAGLGEDALLLAAAGFRVTLYEKNEAVAALLRDVLHRAAQNPELTDTVSRMEAVEGDSVAALLGIAADSQQAPPDVILLDPMFPARRKSAAVRKKFQLIHELERPCADDEGAELLEAALAAHPRKVVVKRPPKGPHLAGRKPSYALSGKAVRYDCYVS